ncbi:lipoprotein [Spiroplasma endosymbiont of Sarcophaga variegata]|uniref:lipoprotein n=1 Tax=Spiroplasma endosymbiont of Sarcophaga variegata TaxID=3066304 RepID=UPI003AF8304A
MKKILSLLGTITLIGTSTTSLVACNTPQHEYTPEELAQLKKENKIKTNNQEIKDNLEWTAPQEKPFNTVDNKWYYVVWRGNKNKECKFNNNTKLEGGKEKNIDKLNNFFLSLYFYIGASFPVLTTCISSKDIKIPWGSKNNYIKSVYRWNGEEQNLPNLIAGNNGNVKINGE